MFHSKFFPKSGLLAAALSGAALLSFPVAAAVTLNIQAGSATYSCTLGALSVSSTGNVSANVSACSPSLANTGETGTGGAGGPTDPTDPTDPTEPGDPTIPVGSNGQDPKVFWSPDVNANPVVYVADQSLNNGEPTTLSRLPGCINGGSIDNASSCTTKVSYSGTVNAGTATAKPVTVMITNSQILSIRFIRSGSAQASSSGSLTVTNSYGGSIGFYTNMWLSKEPGKKDLGEKCAVRSARTPTITMGTSYCSVTEPKGTIYYLNIQPEVPCTTCTWRLAESSTLTVFDR